MNKKPIEQALDADLRYSLAALQRAALRARELALKTGTAIVVNHNGKLEYLAPEALLAETISVQEPSGDYGGEKL